ncbi:MAG: NUDIX hydrolase [Lachnospiraceae bacterium]|nr:NUDIX hydrolase [Lachnospiraceae bacterium]
MAEIREIVQQTRNPFLNMYELKTVRKNGKEGRYFVASRADKPEEIECMRHTVKPDGVIIYAVTADREKVLLVRQYRYPIDDFVYELPAGLIDPGEDYRTAAAREVHEETGLHFTPIKVDPMYERPRYTTIGMTDECCAMVYGCIDGELSTDYLEATEEIIPLLADREEVRRILMEERVAAPCAYHIERFLSEKEPFAYMEE